MLTGPLLRVRCGEDGILRPALVQERNAEVLDRCQAIIDTFASSVGLTRGEVDEQLDQLVKAGGDLKLNKGLVEVAHEYATFQEISSQQACDVRRLLFEAGAARFPVGTADGIPREAVLADVASGLNLGVPEVERLMFSDLREAQALERFDDVTPLTLLRRYNVALTQGILVHAVGMDVTLSAAAPARIRQLMRFLKFFKLLFTSTEEDGLLRLHIDGPLSVLEQTKAYGVRLATFLPALLLVDEFEVKADVKWKRRRYSLHISPEMGLVSHYKDRGSWVPEELSHLMARLKELAPPGTTIEEASAVVSLGRREVYVPDLVICSRGRRVAVEIVWPWRKLNSSWSRYQEAFAQFAPRNALLYVSSRCVPAAAIDRNRDQRILFYRATPLADKLLAFFAEPPALL